MGELWAVVLGGLLAAPFLALAAYVVVGASCAVATVRQARRQRELGLELDEVIEAILGPRSVAGAVAGPAKPFRRG